MPQCKITIYCTFRSERITRVPDDGIYIYSVFQKAVDNDKFTDAHSYKEKERVARKVRESFSFNIFQQKLNLQIKIFLNLNSSGKMFRSSFLKTYFFFRYY